MPDAEIYVGDPDLTLRGDLVPGFLLVRLGNKTRHTLSSVQVVVIASSPAEILTGPAVFSLSPMALVTAAFAYVSPGAASCIIIATFKGPEGIIAQSQETIRLIPSDRETLSRADTWAALVPRFGSLTVTLPKGIPFSPALSLKVAGGGFESLTPPARGTRGAPPGEVMWGCVDPVVLLKTSLAGDGGTTIHASAPLLSSYNAWVESLGNIADGNFLLAKGYEIGRLVAVVQDYLGLGWDVSEGLSKIFEIVRLLALVGISFPAAPVEEVLRGKSRFSDLSADSRAVVDQWLIHAEQLVLGRSISSLDTGSDITKKQDNCIIPPQHRVGGGNK